MKNFLLFWTCLALAHSALAQSDSEKTLVKTLDPKNADFVLFQLPAFATFNKPTKWDNNTLRIELEIHANMTEEILAQLIKANRYTFEGRLENDTYIITAPNLDKKVTIKQVDLVEKIYINVTAPHNYTLDPQEKRFSRDISDFVTMQGNGTRSITSASILKMRQFSEPIEVHIKLVPISPNDNAGAKAAPDKPQKKGKNPPKAEINALQSRSKEDTSLKHGDILINDVPIDPF